MSKRTCSSRSHVQRHTRQRTTVKRQTCGANSLCCSMPTLPRIMRAAIAHNIVASTLICNNFIGSANRAVRARATHLKGGSTAYITKAPTHVKLTIEHKVLQYRLKYRNADLGTSSKAPRFCLKHTRAALHQYSKFGLYPNAPCGHARCWCRVCCKQNRGAFELVPGSE
jgi:hypothetical protein